MRTAFLFATFFSGCVSSVPPTPAPDLRSEITITTEQTCPPQVSSCDILEIVDLHTDAASEDKGFDELRRLAARRGGDAVLGAEFEHGEGDERSHLSGIIVRYGDPIPPHVVLGEIDVPSDPDDQAKGLSELTARGHRMGGDQVIGVTFEHGEGGAKGHLRGRVIRYTR